MSKVYLGALTSEQIKIVDKIWECDTSEELNDYIKISSPEIRRKIITLRNLIVIASDDDVTDMTVAKLMLSSIGVPHARKDFN